MAIVGAQGALPLLRRGGQFRGIVSVPLRSSATVAPHPGATKPEGQSEVGSHGATHRALASPGPNLPSSSTHEPTALGVLTRDKSPVPQFGTPGSEAGAPRKGRPYADESASERARVSWMKEPYAEGLASHRGPGSYADGREAVGGALIGVRTGWALSHEIFPVGGADAVGAD